MYLKQIALSVCAVLLLATQPAILMAATTGSISGTVKDPSDAVIPGVTVIATNTATNIQSKTTTDDKGFYAFPSLPVGRYNVKAELEGFGSPSRNNLDVDANGALVADLTMEMAEKVEEVTVLENAAQVETASSQMGQVVTGTQMTTVALNGRSFTDLLALQPGIVPMSTQQPDSIVMAGASVAIAPSGGLNPGNQSISGQREDANGFMVNGGDVKELMNGGTTIVPELGFDRRVPRADQQCRRRIRQLQRWHRQCGDQRRWQSDSWNGVRVFAKHRSRRPQLFFAGAQLLSAEPIRRHGWRADQERQDFLLRRLSGNADRARNRYGLDSGADVGRTGRQFRQQSDG